MKTVSGRVISSKPVSLSKAARSLKKFVSSEHEASPAFTAYLKRTSASFDELVQLHKELGSSSYESKGKQKHIPDNETVHSVKNPSENGLVSDKKHGTSDTIKRTSDGKMSRNVAGNLNSGEETTKKKKKYKSEREESKGAMKIEKSEQSGPIKDAANGEAAHIVENGSSERKSHSSKKGKHYKKEDIDVTDTINGGIDKKESKKRKHKGSDS